MSKYWWLPGSLMTIGGVLFLIVAALQHGQSGRGAFVALGIVMIGVGLAISRARRRRGDQRPGFPVEPPK